MKLLRVIMLIMFIISFITIFAADKNYTTQLMKDWKIKKADDAKKYANKFYRLEFNDNDWESDEVDKEEPKHFDRYVFYRKWVNIPQSWKGKKIKLMFAGADDDAIVYFNEQNIGRHEGWDESFDFDITNLVKFDEKNLIAVLCDNSGGDRCGIYGNVSIALVEEIAKIKSAQEAKLRSKIKKKAPNGKIIYETYQKNNWELFIVNADGTNIKNLTRTLDKNELYPHVSPDGKKVCFVSDEGTGDSMMRNVYYMDINGNNRIKVADNAREPCWNSDGSKIIYLKGESEKFDYHDFATRGIFIYDLKTGKHTQHPNKNIHHLYNICCSPDDKWYFATVHGGMGYDHAILAIEANGTKVYSLDISGCRPDISHDGKRIAWGSSDWTLTVGDLDFTSTPPKVINRRNVIESSTPIKVYHIDWSNDDKYITFSRGPKKETMGFAPEMVGIKASGWNICVADVSSVNNWMPVTIDGNSNKEPDWFEVREKQ